MTEQAYTNGGYPITEPTKYINGSSAAVPSVPTTETLILEIHSMLSTLVAAKPAPKTRAPREAKPKVDPLAEFLEVIGICKAARGLPFDPVAVRAKLEADPALRRKVRRSPDVAAEFARRAGTPTPAAAPSDVEAL